MRRPSCLPFGAGNWDCVTTTADASGSERDEAVYNISSKLEERDRFLSSTDKRMKEDRRWSRRSCGRALPVEGRRAALFFPAGGTAFPGGKLPLSIEFPGISSRRSPASGKFGWRCALWPPACVGVYRAVPRRRPRRFVSRPQMRGPCTSEKLARK